MSVMSLGPGHNMMLISFGLRHKLKSVHIVNMQWQGGIANAIRLIDLLMMLCTLLPVRICLIPGIMCVKLMNSYKLIPSKVISHILVINFLVRLFNTAWGYCCAAEGLLLLHSTGSCTCLMRMVSSKINSPQNLLTLRLKINVPVISPSAVRMQNFS
jgi:hypothetical protein